MQSRKVIDETRPLRYLVENGKSSEFQQTADQLPVPIYAYDVEQKRISFCNRRFTEIFAPGPKELSERFEDDLINLVHPDDREMVRSELSKFNFLKDENSLTYTARYRTGDNDWKFFRTEGMVFSRNDKGNARSFIFTSQDISNEIKGAAELDASRNFFRETENLLQFGSWRWDPVTDILDWSEGMYALLEYDDRPEPITLAIYAEHIIEADRPRVFDIVSNSIKDKPGFEINYTVRTIKGNDRIVHTKANCIYNQEGNLVKVLGVTRDITQQTRDHKDLVDYKQATLAKEKFLASGSWEYDVPSCNMTWSEGKYRLFGYNTDDPASLPPVTDNLYGQHVQNPTWVSIRAKCDAILKQPTEHVWEYEILTVQGERKILESYASIILGSDGNVEKIIGATRDITRIREYEESLKKKIAELDRSNKELEEFAYIASHDLQEPLRKITAFSERLKEKAATELSPESTVYLDRMLVGAANMRLLIDNLLEFSRTSRHSHPFTTVNLNDILKEVEGDLELKIEETGARIIAESLPQIEAIPSQMRQLFTNLLVNSIKFRKPDLAPELQISSRRLTDKEKQEEHLERDHTYYRIEVRDNGIGFEQEYSNRIFQIFQRLHGKSEYPGSGIGLAICKKIADNHHGKIFAVGEINKGARFIIILPESQA